MGSLLPDEAFPFLIRVSLSCISLIRGHPSRLHDQNGRQPGDVVPILCGDLAPGVQQRRVNLSLLHQGAVEFERQRLGSAISDRPAKAEQR